MKTAGVSIALSLLAAALAAASGGDVAVSRLRCEYLVNPLGIDVTEPRLSWVLDSDVRGQKQTAYRILVAGSAETLAANRGDLWDSGKVLSSRSVNVTYEGKPLKSEMRCWWKVQVWDRSGTPSAWSEPATWTMGLLEESHWRAEWIGTPGQDIDRRAKNPPIPPCPLLRRSFRLEGRIESATLYATALGCYEMRINGRRVGDRVLAPEWTDYNKRVQYQTYDVTALLGSGENVVGAVLADGWYLGRLGLVDIDPNFPRRGYYGIREKFNREFVSQDGQIEGDTQSAYALALHFGLLDESQRPRAVARLVTALERYDGRLSTGIQSTGRMMLELTRRDQTDRAYRLIESRRCPSWLYMIDQGATTIWERWDGYVAGRGFQDPGMNSFNHYALGAVGEWMVRTILGIAPDEQRPGYEHIIIHPRPGGSLTRAKGSYDSVRGEISVHWRFEQGGWLLDVTIPPNATATVHLPARDIADVSESGAPVAFAPGVRYVETTERSMVFLVESGTYKFAVANQSR